MSRVRESAGYYSEKMGPLGWACAAAFVVTSCVGVLREVGTPELAKDIAGPVVDLVPGLDNPFVPNLNISQRNRGKLPMGEYYGPFTSYTNVDIQRIAKLFGQETDSIKVERDGYLVSRWNIPGIAMLDTVPLENGDTYVSRYVNGVDVGIDVSGARFELLRPDTAEDVGGKLECDANIGDRDSTGCVPGVDFDDNILSRLPFAGSNSDWAAEDIANNVFNEYGRLDDPCYWDKWIIGPLNESYASLEKYGIEYKIDGPGQYDEAAKTLIRYFIRSRLSPGIDPSNIPVHLTGEYRPLVPLHERVGGLLERMDAADSITDLNEETSFRFCAERSTDFSGDVVMPFGFGNDISWDRIAIGGMEQVPEGFSIYTGTFQEVGDK